MRYAKLCVLTFLLSMPSFAGVKFMVPGGAGLKNGSDWNNAIDVPSTALPPACGDIIIAAGGTYSRPASGTVNWTSFCTAGTAVLFYKAVDCSTTAAFYCSANWSDKFGGTHASAITPQTVAGWSAAYANQTKFIQVAPADVTTGGTTFANICGSYYDINGITPLNMATPASSGFGFLWQTPYGDHANFFFITNNSCGTSKQNVTAASVTGGTATYTVASVPAYLQVGMIVTVDMSASNAAMNQVNVAVTGKTGTTISTASALPDGTVGTTGTLHIRISNVSIQHSEADGGLVQYGVGIAACSRTSNVATFTLSSAVPSTWVVGDKVSVYGSSALGVLLAGKPQTPLCGITGGALPAGNCGGVGSDFSNIGHLSTQALVIASISGSQFTANQTGSDDSCNINSSTGWTGYAVLDFAGSFFLQTPAYISATSDSVSVTNNYLHDIEGGGVYGYNTSNLTFTNNYVANMGDNNYSQHLNGVELMNGGIVNSTSVTLTGNRVDGNIFENFGGIGATQVCGFLGNGGYDGYSCSNNLITCTDDVVVGTSPTWPQCGASRLSGDNGVSGSVSTNTNIIGNTVYFANATNLTNFGISYQNASSTFAALKNNLLFGNTQLVFLFGGTASSSANIANNTLIGTGGTVGLTDGQNGNSKQGSSATSATSPFACNPSCVHANQNFMPNNATFGIGGGSAWLHMSDGVGVSGYLTDIASISRGTIGGAVTRGAYALTSGANQTLTVTATVVSGTDSIASAPAGISCGITCSAAFTTGTSVVLTATVGAGHSFAGWSGGGCSGNALTCTVVMSGPVSVTGTFIAAPTCSLTFASNSLNAPSLASATTVFTNVAGSGALWFIFGPPIDNQVLFSCLYSFSGCNANGQIGNIIPVGSGLYTAGACSNSVCCTGSTAPLNVNNIGIGGFGH